MAAHGHFHWNELLARNIEAAKDFYAKTIGWSYQPMTMADGATYWLAMLDGQPVAGMYPDRPAGIRRRAGMLDVLSRGRRCRRAGEEGASRPAPS